MVWSFVCNDRKWMARTQTQIINQKFFENVYSVCTPTSLLGIQAHNWIPLGEISSNLYLHGLQAVSTMCHVIHIISLFNENSVVYSRQSPSNTKYRLFPELNRLFVASSYCRQRQDTIYGMHITQKPELSKHACAADCGVKRIRHYAER
jgi:hypothetical protein